ncbi:Similar to hypothetical protein [Tuber melanosporum Mel28]; acc. no. XP_002839811 [Pyronema omphalodes CBS 100304]|uniref:Uncharacterized protein n=1 Tax=Pyronema omphalodes (strain CBS 100304) TaxID=1076935 RepID=U4L5A8_PYROM|nr:Similar to hypothetical protein [Tuber melanosporum Mel28]; acc. no. XP_002839811 [Pyronema omphalodes CBS 100304]
MSHPHSRYFPNAQFHNLDSADYISCESAVLGANTENFIVDFGGAPEDGGQAFCALNVDARSLDIPAFLSKKRDLRLRTRWINIFNPYDQKDLVNAITNFYGFSPRLAKVITTAPASRRRIRAVSPRPSLRMRDRFLGRLSGESRELRDRDPEIAINVHAPAGQFLSVEQTAEALEMAARVAVGPGLGGGGGKMNYMNLVQKVWHFHAVEWGGRFICLGFNHHHKTSPETWDRADHPGNENEPFGRDYNPEGKRVWSWLILCDDGTVISIQEPLDLTNTDDILIVRRNMLTVFRSLSISPAAKTLAANDSSAALGGGLDDLPFRRQQAQSENVHGGPSLLFYYLFDDWHSSYSFVIGRGDPYSTQMSALRNEMHKNPELSHLSKLHRLSRQLAMLKRMYETRKVIVDNILNRQENSQRHRNRYTMKAQADETDPDDPSIQYAPTMGDSEVLGVPLGPLSVAKFERLRDRIKHYVLGELEALLAERSELETLTFNLISLKQSTTVELLTRVTIWFAGFTFVFLPLTLVTGYFSMQIRSMDGKYSEKTFWGAGGVAVTITFLILYTVGKSTGTMEFDAVWRSVKKVWFGWLEKRREKKEVTATVKVE